MIRPLVGLLAALLAAAPSVSYFRYQRPSQPATSSGQHYAVVDEVVWPHARPGLEDLRILAADREIPYALIVERGSRETEQKNVRVLQPGVVNRKTELLLDMAGVQEYDRITLNLTAKNFVVHAKVEGQDDPHGARWVTLGTTTLYDLSAEDLGHNSTLQIPAATFKYLRVTVDGLKPSDIAAAAAGITREEKAVWRELPGEAVQSQRSKDTILTFSIPPNVPVERLSLNIDPSQQNFSRSLEIRDSQGAWIVSGDVSRIHLQRHGQRIDVDRMHLDFSVSGRSQLTAIIHNGDDTPLKIAGARLQQYERRIYFDFDAGTQLRLYYGDEKLAAPVYDYAKLFQREASAVQIQLGPEEANAAYTGRPDERPWSERHPALLWTAILAAVLVLGGLALRSMRTAAT